MTTPSNNNLARVTQELDRQLREFANAGRQTLRTLLGAIPGQPIGAETVDANDQDVLVVVTASQQRVGFASRRGEPDAKVYRYSSETGGDNPDAASLASLQPNEVFALAANPISGATLRRSIDRYVRQASEAALGQQIYAQLLTEINHINAQGNPLRAIEAVERLDRDAQVRGEMLGRHITSSVGDGYAYYLVTDINKERARLQHLPILDGYADQLIGHDAWVERDFVEKHLQSAAAASSFSSRSKSVYQGL